MTPKLDELAKFYGERDFALGYLTIVDFQVAEFSYYIEKLAPELLQRYSFFKRVRTAF